MRRERFPLVIAAAYLLAALLGVLFHQVAGSLPFVHEHDLLEDLTFFVASGVLVGVIVRFWMRDAGRAAHALRESEGRYRSLVGSMDDFVFTLDAEQRYSGTFGRWPGRVQLDAASFLGRSVSEVFGDEFSSRHDTAFRRVMSGATADYEWSADVNGTRRYFHTSMSPLRDDGGRVAGAVGATRDITDKTVLDDAYEQTTDLLHAIVAGSPVAIFTLDDHGRIRSANSAAETILGKPHAQLLGELLVRPAEAGEVARMLRECASSGRSFAGVEILRWRDDGTRAALSISAAPLQARHGGTPGVVAVAIDVSERRRADEMLQRYRLMTRHLRDIVIFVGPAGRIADANEAAVSAYGWPAEELIGMPLSAITGSESCVARFRDQSTESEHVRRDGSRFPVELSAVAAEIDGQPYVFVLARDITARRRRQAFERLLHEIDRRILQNQPLEAILAFACTTVAEQYGGAVVQLLLNDHAPIRTGDAAGLVPAMPIPLVAKNRILGTLELFTRREDDIDPETMNLLFAFADQIALSLIAAKNQQQIALQTVALESAANAVLVTDAHGTIKWVNPAFVRLTGYSASEAIGQKPSLFKSGNHSPAFYRQMWETLQYGIWTGELWNRRKDGSLYVEEQTITPVRADDGRITHYVAIKQDITARRRHEEQIRHLAMHDALTDLPNRRALDGAMERIGWEARRGKPGALMILDVDNFKPVNDTLGHVGGDQLLAELARLLRESLRPADFLARLGGDEFAVLLQDTSVDGAEQVAERLRDAVSAKPFRFGDRVFDLTVSIGIAPIDASIEASTAMVQADSAMYAAKDGGKNRIVAWPFGEQEGLRMIEASRWASRIRNALRDERFVLWYQPVVRIGNGEAEHYEALIRMVDDDGLMIAPQDFISAAERFGLMPQIDRWVVANVLKLLTASEHPARIFVNISGASLGEAQLLAEIERMLVAANLPPGRLAFEITESAAIRDLTIAQSWIRKLKDLGCLFAIDDFGVGFSSFSYLRALSADYVKIDRSFVIDVDTNPTNRALVQAVMTVAQTLGKEVIAEGVETEAHANVLLELGIELAQGYRWGVPVSDPFTHATA